MPIYPYKCPNEHLFEEKHPMAEAGEPSTCPECGEVAPRAYTYKHTLIMRPWGWNLKEGDVGYDNITEEATREVPASRYN